ncbi:hypothetical protein ACGFNV_30510 [Streptomyces sp. NPDC048751]|uniref:hypothetical protein n=1 Tax=Streptomyces sp. NPDC048751 TaxID=3365591 RepID=UPI0037102B90
MPPAPAVCAVVMAHLADGMALPQEKEILRLLLGFVAGEVDGDSPRGTQMMSWTPSSGTWHGCGTTGPGEGTVLSTR